MQDFKYLPYCITFSKENIRGILMVNPVEVCIYVRIFLGLKFREGCSDDGRNNIETMLRVCMQCRVLLTGAE